MDHQSPSFSLFADLPTELRLKIWRFALCRRTVPVRLKLDMDAWNWASDSDWWHGLRLKAVRQLNPMPSACLACGESYRELRPLYAHFSIEDSIWRRCISQLFRTRFAGMDWDTVDGEEEDEERRISPVPQPVFRDAPRLNPTVDVFHWPHFRPGIGRQSLPLFVAACLSARHVSLEIEDRSLITVFQTLTMAVLDSQGPLKTLSIKARNSPNLGEQLYYSDGPLPAVSRDELWVRAPELRLAPVPRGKVRVLKLDGEEALLPLILKQHGACLLPWVRGCWAAANFPREVAEGRRIWTDKNDAVTSKGETEYAVFMVIASDDVSAPIADAELRKERIRHQLHAIEHLSRVHRNPNENWTLPFEPWIKNGNVSESARPWDPAVDWLHFHGFCSPDYGLPG